MTRDEKGRFVKGVSGNPKGRPAREIEESYRAILLDEVTPDDWRAIVRKAKEQAKRGDISARKFIADYIIGPPVERKEITGNEGGPIEFIEIVKDVAPIRDNEEG